MYCIIRRLDGITVEKDSSSYLITNDRTILASITGNGPRFGKYFVNLEGFTD